MITIHSSWGIITCDDNGKVITKDLYETVDEPCYLANAVRFDIDEFDRWHEACTGTPSPKPSEFDVLEIGFWNEDGTYNTADNDWRKQIYK